MTGLRALEAALRTGSFRAAADELSVTTAAVGQRIRSLEDFIECKLFIRTSAGVKPTEHAAAIENKLTQSFSAIAEVLDQLRYRQPKNRLAVTLPSSFAENWFAGRLPEFYRLNSEIDLRLDASNRMVDLVAEDFDFAIRYCDRPPDVYDEIELFGDFVLPVCTPGFAKRYRSAISSMTLEGVPLIHLGDRTPDPQWADWIYWGKTFDFDTEPLREGIRLTEFSSGIQTAISGQGLVLCGITEAFAALKEGLLVAPFDAKLSCPGSFRYRLLSIHGRDLSELQQQFRSWVVEMAEKFRVELDDFMARAAG